MFPIARRTLAATLAVLIALQPISSFARTLPPIDLPQVNVRVVKQHENRVDPVTEGRMCRVSDGSSLPGASPALVVEPVFNSGSQTLTRWGRGWHAESDEVVLLGERQSFVHEDGLGQRLLFLPKAMSATAPVRYARPIGVFTDATATELQGQQPSAVTLREKDGTAREFRVFDSTGALRLSRLTDRNGNTVSYSRDAGGRLTRLDDVHGRFIDVVYNGAGLVERVTDSGGGSTSYVYDGRGRRTSAAGPEGTTSYQYDASDRMTRVTYPNAGVRNYAYDAQGRVASEDDGSGQHALSYVYESTRTLITDALGRTTIYEYTERSGLKKIIKVTDPAGGITRLTYDAAYNLSSQTDPLGRVTRFAHDAAGNVTATEDPAGGRALASYEPTFNQPTSLTDPMNRATSLSYDAEGNLTAVQDALSQSTLRGYDGQGHMTSEEDPLHLATLFSYEPSNGALKTVTDALSRATALQTNGKSLVTRNTDPAGKATLYAYDGAGNLTQVTDAAGGITGYGYEPGREGKLLGTVTDALGHQTSFGYDAQGRLTAVVNALNQAKGSAYDAKDNLTRTTNARGQVITYEYDSRDRLIKKTLPEGTITYAYDDAGNLTAASHYNGSAVQNSYDALNRVTQVIQSFPGGYSATIGYGYDANGNRTSMTTPWGSFAYGYDALNRLTRITNPQNRVFAFQYDAAGRRTKLIYPNGVETSYTYDPAGQVLSIIHERVSDQTVVAKATYTYDSAGNRTSMTDLAGTHTYEYDDLHRLTAAHHPATSMLPVKNEVFSYDAVGNRLADSEISGYAYDVANRLLENSSFTYTYDASGNRTGKTERGTSQATAYAYDSENHMIEAALPGGEVFSYAHDAQGKRIVKSSGTAAGQIARYVYDGAEILAILDGAGGAQLVATHGPTLTAPLGSQRYDGTEHFVHSHALGNVDAATDVDAVVIERVEYEPYGGAVFTQAGTTAAASLIGDPFTFLGFIHDSEIQLMKPPFRNYDFEHGVFMQEDPARAESDRNVFSLARNNPLIYADPLGLWSVSVDFYDLLGAGITVGQNTGQDRNFWMKARFGVGEGAGVVYNPRDQGPAPAPQTLGGAVACVSGQAWVAAGPYTKSYQQDLPGVRAEPQSWPNVKVTTVPGSGTQKGSGWTNNWFTNGRWGFAAGWFLGAEFTFY